MIALKHSQPVNIPLPIDKIIRCCRRQC